MLLLVLALTGCADHGPAIPDSTGTWVGVVQGSGGTSTFTLTLDETSGSVAGTGTVISPTVSQAVVVNGTHSHPHLFFEIVITGFQPIAFAGDFADANHVPGEFNGSGYNHDAVTFVRH